MTSDNPNLPSQLHQFHNSMAGVQSSIAGFNRLILGDGERSSSSRRVAGYGGGRDARGLLEALGQPLLARAFSDLFKNGSGRMSEGQMWSDLASTLARASRRYL